MLLTRRDNTPAKAIADDCHLSIAAEIRRFVAGGTRQILITSSGPGEGKSSVVYEVSRALARQPELRVVVVDTDQMRPSMHRLFGSEADGGLAELVQQVYGLDLARGVPAEFGLGDWIEMLQVQGRTGRLEVTEAGRALVLTFIKGAIASIADRGATEDQRLGSRLTESGHLTPERRDQALEIASRGSEPLGEIALRMGYVEAGPLQAALRAQFGERLQLMLTMRNPRCAFSPATERELGTAVTRDAAAAAGWARQSGAMLMIREHLKQPYLSSALTAALKDTDAPNLKVMTCGRGPGNLLEGHAPAALRCILEHLAGMYDVVLVDSPPVALGSPAEAISEMVGGTVLVVQADRFEAAVIRRAKDRLEKRGAHLLGVILNQVDLQEPDQSYHYYYLYYPSGDGKARRRRRSRRRVRVAKAGEPPASARDGDPDEADLEHAGLGRDRTGLAVSIGLVLVVVIAAILLLRAAPWARHQAATAAAGGGAASSAPALPALTPAAGTPAPDSTHAAAGGSQSVAPGATAPAPSATPPASPRTPAARPAPSRSTAPDAPASSPGGAGAARVPAGAGELETRRFTISIGSFLEAERANAERLKLKSITPLASSVQRLSDGGDESYRVLIGSFATHNAAVKAASDLMQTGQVREALVLPATSAATR